MQAKSKELTLLKTTKGKVQLSSPLRSAQKKANCVEMF